MSDAGERVPLHRGGGTSTESWERAATVAVETAARTLRNLRVAQVEQLDMVIEDGRVSAYRAKVSISFKLQQEQG
jgi:flavin-binding protein dodecin